jgi:L-asparaginase
MRGTKRKIALITTGGTISTFDSGKGAVPKFGARDLLAKLGSRRGEFSVRSVEFAKVPGCEMTPKLMAALARVVARELRRADVSGAVVTHGTDTIEESAYFCHLTIASPKPTVFTGSMRTGSDLSWDGPRNLLDAMRVAASRRARGLGALLTMNEEIHSARFVTKGNGLVVGTFHSPACGPIGRIYNGEPWLLLAPALERRVLRPRIEARVAMVTALAGEDHALGAALAEPGLRGLVIAGFGSGRVPLGWIAQLKDALARGLPIVLASRTGAGAIDDPYGYGGAHYLRGIGLIAAHELPAHKARLKLMVALGNGLGGARLREYMELG